MWVFTGSYLLLCCYYSSSYDWGSLWWKSSEYLRLPCSSYVTPVEMLTVKKFCESHPELGNDRSPHHNFDIES
jgi:hypothetical protein